MWWKKVDDLLLSYLEEDVGWGDVTTQSIFGGEKVRAVMLAKEGGVVAGIPFAIRVFQLLGEVRVLRKMEEGAEIKKGDVLLEIEGEADTILTGERVALNILQRLSGVATLTREMARRLEKKGIKLLDTRKTTPGMRYLEKYAVRVGGGVNHRMDLQHMVLIKDNHKLLAGGVKEAVRRVREKIGPTYVVEVEVENLEELREVLECDGVNMVLLDNFSPEDVKEAVKILKGRLTVEVSGNITPQNIDLYAIEGVHYISSGYITHSARWLDISMRVLEVVR